MEIQEKPINGIGDEQNKGSNLVQSTTREREDEEEEEEGCT